MNFISKRISENSELVTSSVFSAFFWLVSGYVFKFGNGIIDEKKVAHFHEILNGFFTEQASFVFLGFSIAVFLVLYFFAKAYIKDKQFSDLLAIKFWELLFNAGYSYIAYIVVFQSLAFGFLYFVGMMVFAGLIIVVNSAKNNSEN